MKFHTCAIPSSILNAAVTPVDSYLLTVCELEAARRWQRWQTYLQMRAYADDTALLVEQLDRQLPTPYLDVVEQRCN